MSECLAFEHTNDFKCMVHYLETVSIFQADLLSKVLSCILVLFACIKRLKQYTEAHWNHYLFIQDCHLYSTGHMGDKLTGVPPKLCSRYRARAGSVQQSLQYCHCSNDIVVSSLIMQPSQIGLIWFYFIGGGEGGRNISQILVTRATQK